MKQEHLLVLIAVMLTGYIGYQIGSPGSFGFGRHMMNSGYTMRNDDSTGMMQMMGAMLIGKKGAELDRAFLELMIPHHQGAVAMCEPVLKDGERSELKELCRDITESQTREITLMKSWLSSWYK